MDDDVARAEEAAPPSPAESLRLIEAERAAAFRSLSPDPRLIYWPWGLAWFVGFGLLYLRFGPNDTIIVDMPTWLPLTVLLILMAVASTISGVAGARSSRQISGESSQRGLRYGLAWFLGFDMFIALTLKIGDLLPQAERGLLWAAASVGVVGTLYLAGSAIWLDRSMFILGVWLSVLNIGGIVAGPGWHSLVICLGGGAAGLLAAGVAGHLRRGRQ